MSTQGDLVRVPLAKLQLLEKVAEATRHWKKLRDRFIHEDTSAITIEEIANASKSLDAAVRELDEL